MESHVRVDYLLKNLFHQIYNTQPTALALLIGLAPPQQQLGLTRQGTIRLISAH